jgi:hypothetical protein
MSPGTDLFAWSLDPPTHQAYVPFTLLEEALSSHDRIVCAAARPPNEVAGVWVIDHDANPRDLYDGMPPACPPRKLAPNDWPQLFEHIVTRFLSSRGDLPRR